MTYFEITFYLCLRHFAVMFYIFYHILPHSIWINLASFVARHAIIILPPVWYTHIQSWEMKIIFFQHFIRWLKGNTTLNVQFMIMCYCPRWSWATWEYKLGAYDNFPKVHLCSGPHSNQFPCSSTDMVSLWSAAFCIHIANCQSCICCSVCVQIW